MKTNNIDYKFTKEEVESVARLIRLVRENFPGEKETWVRVAKAFNRNVFSKLEKYKNKDN